MFGDVRLVGFGSLNDLGHGAFALLKFMEDAEAHRFGEHFEAAGNELESLRRKLNSAYGCFRDGHGGYIAR